MFDPDDYPRSDFDAVTDHGYDDRATPVDTFMAGPVQMHLTLGDDLAGYNGEGNRD